MGYCLQSFGFFQGYQIFREINYWDICQFISYTCLFISSDMGYLVPPHPLSKPLKCLTIFGMYTFGQINLISKYKHQHHAAQLQLLRPLKTHARDTLLCSFCDHYDSHIKHSKWVWSGNTTITNRRQSRGIARKSHSTITRHQEDKLSKVTSSFFPIKMIAILEWTQSNVQQSIEQLQTPTIGVTINEKSTTTEPPP